MFAMTDNWEALLVKLSKNELGSVGLLSPVQRNPVREMIYLFQWKYHLPSDLGAFCIKQNGFSGGAGADCFI